LLILRELGSERSLYAIRVRRRHAFRVIGWGLPRVALEVVRGAVEVVRGALEVVGSELGSLIDPYPPHARSEGGAWRVGVAIRSLPATRSLRRWCVASWGRYSIPTRHALALEVVRGELVKAVSARVTRPGGG